MHAAPLTQKETQTTAQTPVRANEPSVQHPADQRPEAAAQLKLQELADGSPQVMQLQKMQENASPVVQLAKAKATSVKRNHYKEKYNGKVKITKKRPTKYDMLKISETDYNKLAANSRSTEEEGYTDIDLDGEPATDWVINDRIVEFSGGTIQKKGSFKLPVSCIESAEHVVNYSKKSGAIPDWKEGQKKSVDLQLNNNNTGTNEKALSVSNDELLEPAFKDYGSFDFSTSDVQLNEGLLVINPKEPSTTLHAVVVVGKNTSTNQILVLERNAGDTSGNTLYYVDNSWLLNVYDSPAAFYASMKNPKLLIGKLVAH